MRRVVVALTGSASSRTALRWAAARAADRAATLEVVTAVSLTAFSTGPVGAATCLPDRARLVDATMRTQDLVIDEELPERSQRPEIVQTVEFGDLVSVLRDVTADADLAVLGRGGRRWTRPSTRRCLASLPFPVVVVADGRPC